MDEERQRRALFTFEDADFTAAMRDEVCEWLEHGKNMENHKRQQAFKTLRKDKDVPVPPPQAAPAPPPQAAPAPAVRIVPPLRAEAQTAVPQVDENMASAVRIIAARNDKMAAEEIAASLQIAVEDVRAVLSRVNVER